MRSKDLKAFLEEQVARYNQPDFIPNDPISIPHQFTKKQDIEIAGFIAAVFSWGNRRTIVNKSNAFLGLMDNSPHDFILNHGETDLKRFLSFTHRTFQPTDALYFIEILSRHYRLHDSLEELFITTEPNMEVRLNQFAERFFSLENAPNRTRKHVPSPARKSTCKRINMFLRWMVRQDDRGVDFGLWKQIAPAELVCPIDVHVSSVARSIGLLHRKQNDWQAAVELTENLRKMDAEDPVKYDFALFGMGVNGYFSDVRHFSI
jgi:uncharacterized protein (TIGR02757 family)